MSTLSYNSIALDWQLPGQSDRRFRILSLACLVMLLVTAISVSRFPVADKPHRERAVVPDRVARFVASRPPAPTLPPEVEPRVLPPPPPPAAEQPPTVQRERQQEIMEAAPLTEAQRDARERAQSSGLLALHKELAPLMDTAELAGMIAGSVDGGEGSNGIQAKHDLNIITGRAAAVGEGMRGRGYGSQVGGTALDQREIAGIRAGLFGDLEDNTAQESIASTDGDGGMVSQARSREDVTIIFDQNKGALYALYARERRRSPGLEGRIVLRITIAPSGEVTDVQVVSSELNSPSLESGIIGRIKMFRFKAMDVDEITVTYPIEFLPS